VIRFNNTIFRLIPELLQQHIEAELSDAGITENPVGITVPEVYADSVQEVSNTKVADLGNVRIRFLESKRDMSDENEELILSELIETIKSLQDKGVKAIEMAILVRQKKEARLIADLFLEQKSLPENSTYNFDILSGESLYINNSEVISLIISILTYFLNPDDQVVKAQVNYLYYRKIYPRLKEMGKVPEFGDEQEPGGRKNDSGRQSLLLDLFSESNERKDDLEKVFEPDLNEQFEKTNDPENELLQFIAGKAFQELVAGKPILEIIYSICEKFNLFSLADELAYLQAFVDQISVFERNHASELTSFLEWWSENGDRFTIPISDSIDAINVLTIHKSKGLEFTHVFVPFFDWSVHPHSSPEMAPLLWCKPEIEPFNEMELVPIRYKSDVGNSIFYREFFTEKFNTYVDNLNLMYVVFTRAKAGLYIWASYSSKLSTVGDLLKLAVEKQASLGSCGLKVDESVDFGSVYDSEKMLVEIGEYSSLQEKKKDEQTMKDVRLSSFEFADFRKFLNIRKRGEDFFTQESKKQSGINKGKLIHEILSLIATTDDLHKAVKRIETEGKIGSDVAEAMITELTELLSDPEVKSWFDGTYRVVNERNILTGANGVKRPDRIMIGADGVVVVDYKSGDMESDKYKYQLRTYIRELKNCGFQNVSGYIWYTKANKRVAV